MKKGFFKSRIFFWLIHAVVIIGLGVYILNTSEDHAAKGPTFKSRNIENFNNNKELFELVAKRLSESKFEQIYYQPKSFNRDPFSNEPLIYDVYLPEILSENHVFVLKKSNNIFVADDGAKAMRLLLSNNSCNVISKNEGVIDFEMRGDKITSEGILYSERTEDDLRNNYINMGWDAELTPINENKWYYYITANKPEP